MIEDACEQLKRIYAWPGEYLRVNDSMTLNVRFAAIRHNYQRKEGMVAAGLSGWFKDDPYEIADWLTIFTPIENSMWQDIRSRGLDLWPQLPVNRFFLDFANPIAKVAIECDGKQWHDAEKDAARDAILNRSGWSVFRVPGWKCNGRILDQDEADFKRVSDRNQWNKERTPLLTLDAVRDRLEWARK